LKTYQTSNDQLYSDFLGDENNMTQTDQVIFAMREAGGSATFERLNELVDFSNWQTKTPEATIRRIVQESPAFFKITPGLWALTESIRTTSSGVNIKLSYCAYFLSKFDMQAVRFLGFATRDEAISNISGVLGKQNNYLKRRRDEFDVLTDSHRIGQQNRPPAPTVLRMHQELKDLSFQELSHKIRQIIPVPRTIYPDDLPDNSPEYREGKKKMVQVNMHERNPAARRACIRHYGATCYVCGFDFGRSYGIECDGMIHVHHLELVSQNDEEYTVDPINDLRPVCPNCHMVIHSKKDGLYTIDEVKEMLRHTKSTQ
jgi:5-methylcytosine-specific restriction protein A